MANFGHRVQANIRRVTPFILSVLLIIMSAGDFNLPGVNYFFPMVGLMAVFYWAVYWPSLLPAWSVFLLGILQDVLFATPIGSSALLMLMLWLAVRTQRRYFMREVFLTVWLVFCFIALLFLLLSSGLYSLYYGHIMLSEHVLMQWLFSALLYPFIHKLFSVVHESFIRQY